MNSVFSGKFLHGVDPLEALFTMGPIQTPRLLLRRMEMGDAADIYAYGKDPEVARHVLWDPYTSVSDARGYIRAMQRKYRNMEPSSWGIEYEGHIVGTIGYMWYNHEHSSTEVGYSLARRLWNQGLMTEALRAVVNYTFKDLHINRIEAQHELTNPASGKVMLKCGMRQEGVLRQRLRNKGHYVDVALYAILRDEWKRVKS